MIENILKLIFRLKRINHLTPFLDSLTHIGRPSEVSFPQELLEQGMGLALSGLNNTLAIQSNLDWLWPYWYVKQQNPTGVEFIPTGVNLFTANLSLRNWTSIGNTGSKNEAMVDPVGMVTLNPFGWSFFPYIRIGGKNYFPPKLGAQIQQNLIGTKPGVITKYKTAPGMEWDSTALPMVTGGMDAILLKTQLSNSGEEPIDVIYGVSIRPYNPLTIGHINKIKFNKNLWRINRHAGLYLFEKPDYNLISNRSMGDPLFSLDKPPSPQNRFSKSGIISSLSEYRLRLEPGESRSFNCAGILKTDRDPAFLDLSKLTDNIPEEAENKFHTFWDRSAKNGLKIKLPDSRIQNAFDSVRNHLHVFDDGTHFTPGTFFYHTHWYRDGAFIHLAFEYLGLDDCLDTKIAGLFKKQDKTGFFRSQNGEWDSNGQALVTLVNRARFSGDISILIKHFSEMYAGVKWIAKKVSASKNERTPHYGLLPAGLSAEHFGPNDHYFWDNFWSLAGIEALIWTCRKLNRTLELQELEELYEDYRSNVQDAMDLAMARINSGGLPSSPYRTMDSASIGNLVALVPLNLFEESDSWVKPTVDYLTQNNLEQNLFFQKIIHTGLNPYLTIQLAKVMLVLGDKRWKSLVNSLLDFASPTFTWPEAIHPGTKGGCMGDGDHGWAAAEFISLVRNMLILEQRGRILLGLGISEDWLTPGKEICVEHAPTHQGHFNFSINSENENIHLKWNFAKKPEKDDLPVYLTLDSNLPLAKSENIPKNNGRYWIRLLANQGELTLPLLAQRNIPEHNNGKANWDSSLSKEKHI